MAEKGFSHVLIAMAVVFVAAFTLFYIFDSLGKLSESCDKGAALEVCGQLNSFSLSLIFIILIIGGFVLIITAVVYIMLSAK